MPNQQRKILKYSQQNMLDAIDEVKKGNSVKATAKKYGVPRVTLMYKVNGKLPIAKRMGPKGIFTTEQENILVEWIISMSRAGFPVTKNTFMITVARLAKELSLEKVPGEKWYKLFRARNDRIRDRIYQTLTRSRANVTSENLVQWFKEVWSYIQEKDLVNVMNISSRVFDADETAFYMNPKSGKVLAEKGSKSVYLAGANDEKENITVLLTANAAGQICPPMIVYRYKRIPLQIAEAIPSDWAIGKSENGWMTQELFFEFIANIFHPWLLKEKIELPVIFFLDGHSSHISLHVSEFCAKHGIELIALYPNATHLIQPMDVAVFHSLKTQWRKQVQDWRMSHTGEELKKKDFPPLLKEVIERIDPLILQNGFKKCGLLPWNPQAVNLPLNNPLPTAKTNINEIKTFLLHLENEIGEEKVLQFKNNEGDWKGPKEDWSLYSIWRQIKNKLEQPPLQEVTKTSENIATELEPDNIVAVPLASDNIAAEPLASDNIAAEPLTFDNVATEPPHEQRPEISIAEPGPSGLQLKVVLHDLTPHKENNMNGNQKSTAVDPTIPSPFKRVLFWPEVKPSTSKRIKREKIPTVLTSSQAIRYYQKKEEDKQQKAEKQAKKKEEREQKRKEVQERKTAAEEQKSKNKEKSSRSKQKRQEDSDSTTSESLSIESADSPPWDEDFEDVNNEEDDLPYQSVNSELLMEGDFVLCEFIGGKRNQTKFVYLCVVQEKRSDIQVMGLKSTDRMKKEFIPHEQDISSVTIDQIIGKVPQPEILRRGERISYVFQDHCRLKKFKKRAIYWFKTCHLLVHFNLEVSSMGTDVE